MRLLEYIDDNIKSDIEEIGCLNMDQTRLEEDGFVINGRSVLVARQLASKKDSAL